VEVTQVVGGVRAVGAMGARGEWHDARTAWDVADYNGSVYWKLAGGDADSRVELDELRFDALIDENRADLIGTSVGYIRTEINIWLSGFVNIAIYGRYI